MPRPVKKNKASRKNDRRTRSATRKADGFSPERSKKAKDRVANTIGAIGSAAVAVKGLRDIKKLKDLR